MKLETRDDALIDVVQNLDSDGNAEDTLQIASRAEALKDIVSNINGSGHLTDAIKLATRDVAVIDVLQYLSDNGRATDSRLINPSVVANIGALIDGSSPLSAIDAGTDATISIASFTMKFDFGDLNYNAGSITGLTYSTKYYVYADDADYSGGTVTYAANLSSSTVVASSDYIYIGTITTPAASGGPTSGAGGGGYYEP